MGPIKFNAVKCPSCNANLSIEEGRTSIYCSYCGTQIILSNENEHIIRHIDETKIVESKNEKDIRLKELEIKKPI